jgi:hypothetical protein
MSLKGSFTIKSDVPTNDCTIYINVQTEPSQGLEYYNISYTYEGNYNTLKESLGQNTEEIMEGEFIVKNEFINQSILHLVMDNETLGKNIGTFIPQEYKLRIMQSLSLFWN